MKRLLFGLFGLMLSSGALAQPAPQPITIDAQLWSDLQRAVGDVPMSATAHQQIQQILNNVQREAQMREARAKAKAEADVRAEKN